MELFSENRVAIEKPLTPSEHVDLLTDILASRSTNPLDGDLFLGACSVSLSHLIEGYPDVRARIEGIIEHRAKYKPGEKLLPWAMERMVTTASHMFAWRELSHAGFTKYPDAYLEPSTWEESQKQVFAAGKETTDEWGDASLILNSYYLNTIKPGRRRALEFIIKRFKDRSDKPIDVLDIGCSRNDLLAMIAVHYPHRPVEVTGGSNDHEYSIAFNKVLGESIPRLGYKTGIDILPFPDPMIEEWFESQYIRPKDRNEREKTKVYEFNSFGDMALKKRLGVDQLSADFADSEIVLARKRDDNTVLADSYDIVNCSFMLYQLNEERRLNALMNMSSRLKKNGILLLQDNVIIDLVQPNKLYFPDEFKPYGCSTLAFDKSNPEQGFQRLFTWKDGSCDTVSISNSPISKELWADLVTEANI